MLPTKAVDTRETRCISLGDESSQPVYLFFSCKYSQPSKAQFLQIFLNELPYYFRFNPLLNLSWEHLIGHFIVDKRTI